MDHFTSMCFSSILNNQEIYGHRRNFDDKILHILWSHHIQYFILKAGDSVHYQPKDNGPKYKLNNLYGNSRMNWMSKHKTSSSRNPK